MKSLYKRELAMMVGIVTLSFTLLSTAFMLLSYRYIISETRDRLERNAGYIASATGNYLQNFNSWNIFDSRADTWILYQTTMETVSSVSDASVIVASTQGEILYASDEGMYSKQIPQQIVDQILERGNYAGLTNLNGIYGSNRYIAGLPVQVQLVQPEMHREIFGLPNLLIGVAVFHADVAHDPAASGIVPVVGRRDIGQSILFHLLNNRLGRFCHNSFMPELLTKPVAEIVMLLHVHFDVADGIIVLLQTDRVGIGLRLDVFCGISFLIKPLCFFHVFDRIPG